MNIFILQHTTKVHLQPMEHLLVIYWGVNSFSSQSKIQVCLSWSYVDWINRLNCRNDHCRSYEFLKKRDWVFNAVGVPASIWQFTAMSDVLTGRGIIKGDQQDGLISTGIGSSVLGLSYLSTKYQIDTYDSLFAGSSMVWESLLRWFVAVGDRH